MPKEVTERLILASQTYMKTRDSIALVAAFQLDEVPTYLSKCFEVHAQISIKGTISSRDFAHFYDGSERAMRLLLFIELAKRRGQAVETIKKLNDQMYEGILRFNREHY
jgi:hypothetical protein